MSYVATNCSIKLRGGSGGVRGGSGGVRGGSGRDSLLSVIVGWTHLVVCDGGVPPRQYIADAGQYSVSAALMLAPLLEGEGLGTSCAGGQ